MDEQTLDILDGMLTFEKHIQEQARLSKDAPGEPEWVHGGLRLLYRVSRAARQTFREVNNGGGA